MKCGIIGLPNIGKSTLFNCLSSTKAQSANYPFCTIEPNIGFTLVPDRRIFELEKIVNPQRVIPAVVEIVDIAGLIKGASKGEGLGNKFLTHIRDTHAIIHVLRCFENKNIIHVDGSINPIRDKQIIDIELQLKDLEIVEKQLEKTQKNTKIGNNDNKIMLTVLNKIYQHLLKGKNVRELLLSEIEKWYIKNLQLITLKPVLYVCNVDENSLISGNQYTDAVKELVIKENAEIVILDAQTEYNITELDSLEDKQLFLSEIGLLESRINKLIQSTYDLLDLQTYFTVGVKEVRAWTIHKGDSASKAARVIHSDLEKGFIRAEVIKYDDYIKYRSEVNLRGAGKISIEGKEYIVEDGDIIHFRFNI